MCEAAERTVQVNMFKVAGWCLLTVCRHCTRSPEYKGPYISVPVCGVKEPPVVLLISPHTRAALLTWVHMSFKTGPKLGTPACDPNPSTK